MHRTSYILANMCFVLREHNNAIVLIRHKDIWKIDLPTQSVILIPRENILPYFFFFPCSVSINILDPFLYASSKGQLAQDKNSVYIIFNWRQIPALLLYYSSEEVSNVNHSAAVLCSTCHRKLGVWNQIRLGPFGPPAEADQMKRNNHRNL